MSQLPRICMVTVQHSSKDDRIYFKQARSLRKVGYEVSILSSNADGLPVDMAGIPISVGPDEYGIEHHCVKEPRRLIHRVMKRFYKGPFYRQMIEEAVNLKADLYIAHEPQSIMIARHAAASRRAKVLFDCHESLKVNNAKDKFAIENHLPGITHCLAVSSMVKDDILNVVPKAQVELIRNASIFHGATPKHEAKLIICFEGSLPFNRGLREMVSMFIEVLEIRGLDVYFRIIGTLKGEEKRFFDQLKASHPKLDQVEFTGWLDYTKIPEAYSNCSLGLIMNHPEGNNVYSSPNKLFNYMAFGLGIISIDLPMVREVIETHQCGRLIDQLDPVKFADVIEALASNPEQLLSLRKASYEAHSLLSWDKESKKLISFIEAILDSSTQRG
jgi:glycosyltransferase involved in cell wall biosynthesis